MALSNEIDLTVEQLPQNPITLTPVDGTDYNNLVGKPKVNSVVLEGNKTSAQLGLASAAQGAKADSAVQPADLSVYRTATEQDVIDNGKQDTISDLETIRSGAALGATAVQPGDLATVATSGAYSDLSGTPTIPTVDQTYSASSTNAQSGVAVGLALSSTVSNPLFYYTFADHLFSNTNWLRADTFSWQDGSVYTSAYQHLVNDLTTNVETLYCWNRTDKEVYTTKENPSIGDNVYIINDGIVEFASTIDNISGDTIYPSNMQAYTRYSSGDINNQEVPITAETETIAGTTITFYRATDGHKICLANQAGYVSDLYDATGVAWYYILDTANTRFKLPRMLPLGDTAPVIGNGTTLGLTDGSTNIGLMNFGNDDLVARTGAYGTNVGTNTPTGTYNTGKTLGLTNDPANSGLIADLSHTSNDGAYKYLYFYCGNTVINQTTIDVGQITEALNSKADTDLSNVNNTGSSKSAGWAMPSDTYIDLTLGASGTTYTAPANGYFAFGKKTGSAFQRLAMFNYKNSSDTIIGTSIFSSENNNLMAFLPVVKGDSVAVTYTATGETIFFRFIYAEGSKSEAN